MFDVPELKQTLEWLEQFIDQADPDPFRTRLRDRQTILADEQRDLVRTDKSLESLLTVYTGITALHWSHIPAYERAEYLMRAHQKYSQDFFVNWSLPQVAGGDKNRLDYAYACYSLRPDNPAVLAMLGGALIADKKPKQAIEPLERLTKVAPWYFSGHNALGRAYQQLGETDKAQVCFR